MFLIVKRGDIFYADLGPVIGSEQDGIRPIVIIQNDIGNKYSPTVIGLAITTKTKSNIPTHIPITVKESGLSQDSVILVEQIRTIDKCRLINKVGYLNQNIMDKVKDALKISFNIRGDLSYIFNNW